MAEQMTGKEVEAAIIGRTMKDESFRKEFLADPKGTIEKYSGQKLPADVQVHAHLASPKNVHFVIPDKKAMEGELSEADLEKVAGGEFFIAAAAAAIAFMGPVQGSIAVANDLTRARAGW